jgi:ATP-binding cassette subfamily B protein
MVSYKQLITFVWQFVRKQKGVFLTIFLLDAFAWPLDSLMFPYILHLVVDIFTRFEADRAAAWGALQGPIWAAIGLMVYVEIASRTMGFLMAKAIPKLEADIRMAMFDHIQHHSPRYFNERFAGSLANKMTDMTSQVDLIIQQLFWPVLPSISACFLGAGFFWFVNPIFTWVFLVWAVLHFYVCLKFARPADMYEHRHGEARSSLLGKIVDSFTNNFAVNLFYRFRYEKNRTGSFQKVEEETNRQAKTFVEKMRCYLSLVYFIGGFLGINGLLLYFWVHGIITTGQVVQVFATMVSLATVLWNLSSSLPLLFQSFGIVKQAYSLMLDPQDILDEPGAKDLEISSGQIVFDNVSFHYGERKLFQNKHVQIRGGEKIGLVGFTGAGKSTFINLILRFFPLEEGKILIDGQDISAVKLETLRKQIALIPQDPVLFHRTLRENICYGKPEAEDGEILRASKLAHCDEFIGRIPGGYDAKVGERGTKLSGGEKQRIAIARAILMDAPLLILDEATSALDSVTERYIQDSLEKLMKNRTTIVIAHRLSTLSRMDRILVFDQGKIVEEGSSDFLINENGLYAHMWKMQVGGFLPDGPVS